jgi:hypothetical protein
MEINTYYSGMTETGALILRPEVEASIRAHYQRMGWPWHGSAGSVGYATDSAASVIADEEPDENAELTAAYERMLRGGAQPVFKPTLPDDDFEKRAASTRGRGTFEGVISGDPAEEEKRYAVRKRALGWDQSPDATMRLNFQLGQAYGNWLREAQPLPPPTEPRDARGGF